jgi:hypothetical protein
VHTLEEAIMESSEGRSGNVSRSLLLRACSA